MQYNYRERASAGSLRVPDSSRSNTGIKSSQFLSLPDNYGIRTRKAVNPASVQAASEEREELFGIKCVKQALKKRNRAANNHSPLKDTKPKEKRQKKPVVMC